MATLKTSKWKMFFREAGINDASAAAYADMFVRHDINEDLIIELTRQILREMGITIMGHTLAILKHAKVVHEKLKEDVTKQTAFNCPNAPKIEVLQPSSRLRQRASAPSHPESQEFDLSMSQNNKLDIMIDLPAICSPPQPAPFLAKNLNKKHISPRVPSLSKSSSVTKLKVTDRLGILKNSFIPENVVGKKRKPIISNSSKEYDVLSAKRVCEILPEENYSVTINSSGTSTRNTLPNKQTTIQVKPSQSKTVFGRLSDISVSSTTEQKSGGSVFARLGKKSNETPEQSVRLSNFNPATRISNSHHPSTSLTRTITQFKSDKPAGNNLRARDALRSPQQTAVKAVHKKHISPKVALSSKSSSPSTRPKMTENLGMLTTKADAVGGSQIDESIVERPSSVKLRLGNTLGSPALSRWAYNLPASPNSPHSSSNWSPEIPTRGGVNPMLVNFDASMRNKFRSDNIAKVSSIANRFSQDEDDDEWEY